MSIIEGHWDYNVDLNDLDMQFSCKFEPIVNSFKERILEQLVDDFKVLKFVYNGKTAQNHDDELKDLVDTNRILRNEIDSKLNELSQQQLQYDNYKKGILYFLNLTDQKQISQEIKDTHEAFLMAKKYYKKFLKMYHTIESRNGETQTIFLQFFTEAKRDSENYAVRLLRNIKTGKYQLISTTPKIPNFKDYQSKLQETNDVPGALCAIRQTFIAIKSSKK